MVKVQNIYYMLAYAFSVLNEQGFKNLGAEEFGNTAELFAAILARGISSQIKRGLGREYLPDTEALSTLRGKIDVSASVKTRSVLRRQMVCTYDDFSVNSCMNRVIKSVAVMLMKADISRSRKKELRGLLQFFSGVELVNLRTVDWNFRYNRNNQTYRMMLAVCYLTVNGLLQTQSDGTMRMMDFLDERNLPGLYEKFILEYFRKEFPQLRPSSPHVEWQVDDDFRDMLPIMRTDVTLTHGDKMLIIDAKCYSHATAMNFGTRKFHSGNLYQIFTYVKNAALSAASHEVSGMLLYAKTDEEGISPHEYSMSGSRISVRTLDLSGDFEMIREQLNDIAEKLLC
ncbi:MAG: 5-methylcytosine-specific restriction endonuclease system specificity protein McrC [Synergistaceae bacterium]|nr:5-methylcytosine-specific restriction endonuclease system specificity protein McrC [Synergistaceae bacterium]